VIEINVIKVNGTVASFPSFRVCIINEREMDEKEQKENGRLAD